MSEPPDSQGSRFSVIVVHYNGLERLTRCLSSLLLTNHPNVEVIVVDNASPDGSGIAASKLFPNVRFVFRSTNGGYGAGCNEGALVASGTHLVFLNNDTTVDPDWLARAEESLRRNRAQVATPKIVVPGPSHSINAAGGCQDLLGTAWTRGNGEPDRGQFDEEEMVFFGSACLIVDRRAWKKVGPFDETYFMYVEDVDWCWRAISQGYGVLYVPSAVVYHEWGVADRQRAWVIGFIERNALRSMIKNHTVVLVTMLVPPAFLTRAARAFYLRRRSRGISDAILQSLAWNLRHLGETWSARGEFSASHAKQHRSAVQMMSPLPFEILVLTGRVTHPHQSLL